MARLSGGVVLAAAALFVWGFLYWGISLWPYRALQTTANDVAAQQVLLKHFPVSGTYLLPNPTADAGVQQALRSSGGPTGLLHLRYGAPAPGDPIALVKGFGLNLVFAAVMALLLYRVRSSARTYAGRLGVAFWLGVAAVVLIDAGDWVWWGATVQWKLIQAGYDFSAFLLVGGVLSAFIKSEGRGRLT